MDFWETASVLIGAVLLGYVAIFVFTDITSIGVQTRAFGRSDYALAIGLLWGLTSTLALEKQEQEYFGVIVLVSVALMSGTATVIFMRLTTAVVRFIISKLHNKRTEKE